MTIKDCFGDGLVKGSKILLLGREYSLVKIEHLEGNVYGATVESGIEGDDVSYMKVSAEHEVLVPVVKAKSKDKDPDPFDIDLTEDDSDVGEKDVNPDDKYPSVEGQKLLDAAVAEAKAKAKAEKAKGKSK